MRNRGRPFRRGWRFWLLTLSALLVTLQLNAESPLEPVISPHYSDNIRHYGSEDGLPQNSVNAIVQSQDGYLWLGTYGGLTRFDGTRFTLFRSLAQQGPSSDRIISLLEDAQRRLWIGTEDSGISLLQNGRFIRLGICDGRCRVNSLLRTESGLLAATSVGLFAIASDTLTATRIGPEQPLLLGVSHAGKHYIAGPTGLWRVLENGLEAVPWPTTIKWSRPTLLTMIDTDLVIGLADDLYRLTESGWLALDSRTRLPGITAAVRDPAGKLWVSDNAGHSQYQTKAGLPFVPSATDLGSVSSQWIDREQNLWLGSNGRGLFRIRPARIALLNDSPARFDLPGMPVTGDGRGGMWFGLNCDGLRHIDADGRMREWPSLGDLKGSCPWAFHQAADGALYIGTSDGQLGVIRTLDGEIRKLRLWPSYAIVRAIYPIDANTLWVAVDTQTFRVRLSASGAVLSEQDEAALGGMRVNWITKAIAGGHWFAGDQGVMRLLDGKVVERWGIAEGLSSRFARAVFEEKDGRLWVGTYGGGLNVVHAGKITQYSEEGGLFDDVVSCILEDGTGRLWLSGNRGISMIPVEMRARAGRATTLNSVGFAAEDGLLPSETNGGSQSACAKDEAGHLWFPLISGFAMVDPDRAVISSAVAPKPIIETVRVAGQALNFGSALKLKADARNLEIHYSAPSLSAPDKTHFRFRWSGDLQWTETGTQRSLYFPLIPWGELQLQVAARVGGGPWSAQPAILNILHPLPWYQRPGAWVALLFGAVALSWAIRRGFTWFLRLRAERVARPIREHVEQLARDNRRLSDQALNDGLTGVANRRHFNQRLDEVSRQRERIPMSVSMLLIDVDEFKRYNDHFGHTAGDDCLRAVAYAMQAAVSAPHMLARYGGEEFVVLMAGADADAALLMAQQLRERISQLKRAHVPSAQHALVTVSIGIATQSAGATADIGDLIARADRAMYRAKHGGRDRIEVSATV